MTADAKTTGRVGFFMALGLILGTLLLWSFSKGLSWFQSTYELKLKAEAVGGLKPRSAVLLAGVPIGQVGTPEITRDGRGVLIPIHIKHRYRIHADARFVIEQIGFLGDQYVAVYVQGNHAPELRPGDIAQCDQPLPLQEIARSTAQVLDQAGQTLQLLNQAVQRVEQSLLSAQTLSQMSNTVVNLERFSSESRMLVRQANDLIMVHSNSIALTVSNLQGFSQDLAPVSDVLRQFVETNSVRLEAGVVNLEATVRVVNQLAVDLEEGRGVAGSLLRDTNLQIQVTQLIENLTSLSSNLNNYGLLYKPKRPRVRPVESFYPGKSPFR